MRQDGERLQGEISTQDEMILKMIMMIAGEAQDGYKDAEFPKKEEINKQRRLRWTITLTLRIRHGFSPWS